MLSLYAKQRVVYYYDQGLRAPSITKLLQEEGINVSRVGVYKFLIRYKRTGNLARREGSSPPHKITPEVKEIVEQQMQLDDETTACQLHKLLLDKGFRMSRSTILRCRTELGWTFRGSAYCQLIRPRNKVKRLEWARHYQHEAASGFEDVIWTDESTIQIETHKRFCYRKIGHAAKSKPRFRCNFCCYICVDALTWIIILFSYLRQFYTMFFSSC